MKVLIYDIETSANLGYTWGKYQQNIIEYKNEWEILTISWKWLGEKRIYSSYRQGKSDFQLTKKIRSLLDRADVVVGHNVTRFDNKKVLTRILFHNLPPPSPFQVIDTYNVARRRFRFNSNKLEDLCVFLGIGRKIKTEGFSLWKEAAAGREKALKKMAAYNRKDVWLTEQLYLKMRPWVSKHPNLFVDDPGRCPRCGSTKLVSKGKEQAFCCTRCGGHCRSLKRELRKVSL